MQSVLHRLTCLRTRTTRLLASAVLVLGLAAAGGVAVAGPAHAAEIGQAPTASNITGNGSFAVTTSGISSASGFGGGQVYYPTTAGTYPVIAISPGFTAYWSSLSWLGPRLASWGFVVVGIETITTLDQPASRGSQLRAALDWAVGSAPTAVRSRADTNRRGVAGHSMGGGGTIEALKADTSGRIKAGVALTPWDADKTWPEITEPVAFVGGEADTIAPPASHAIPFYNSRSGPEVLRRTQRRQPLRPEQQQPDDFPADRLLVQALPGAGRPLHAVHLRLQRIGGLRLPYQRLLTAPPRRGGSGRRAAPPRVVETVSGASVRSR